MKEMNYEIFSQHLADTFDISNNTAQVWNTWAMEMERMDRDNGDPENRKDSDDFLQEFWDRFTTIQNRYGDEITRKVILLADIPSCLYPWEMYEAAAHFASGGSAEDIPNMAAQGLLEEDDHTDKKMAPDDVSPKALAEVPVREVKLQAEHSPYWVRLYETSKGVSMEDIFASKDKKDIVHYESWETAIMAAMKALSAWSHRIDGFEKYIPIKDAGWTDIVIAHVSLSELYPKEAEHLKKLLAGGGNFDTGKSWTERGRRSLRILAVEEDILLEVEQELPSLPSLIRQNVTSDDEMLLSEELISEIAEELEDNRAFARKATAKALMPHNTPYEKLMEKIALLEQQADGQLDESRAICRTITQNYLKGSLLMYSVIVQIPNCQQKGLLISARTTEELFEKIGRKVKLGCDATITYSAVLIEEDFLYDMMEICRDRSGEKRQRFSWDDISFDHEIIEQDGMLNFYVPVTFDYAKIFGSEYRLLDEVTSMNVYASYDLKENKVCESLSIVIQYPEGPDENRQYHLSAREQALFLQKMNSYCVKQTGKDLLHWNCGQ